MRGNEDDKKWWVDYTHASAKTLDRPPPPPPPPPPPTHTHTKQVDRATHTLGLSGAAAEPAATLHEANTRACTCGCTGTACIGMGGGGGTYGLWLDEHLDRGSSGRCETFDNPVLCSGRAGRAEEQRGGSAAQFRCECLEVWSLLG